MLDMWFLRTFLLVFFLTVLAQNSWAIDIECKFSGERKTTTFTELVSGENIAYVGSVDDDVRKKEIYWGDDYLTIIVETTGMATLVVINRKDLTATKRVTRAGISRGEARGWCRMLPQNETQGERSLDPLRGYVGEAIREGARNAGASREVGQDKNSSERTLPLRIDGQDEE